MPSNGAEIFAMLLVNFPQAQSNMQESLQGAWKRELAKQEWDTKECVKAIDTYLRSAKPKFLPSLPQIKGVIDDHHRRLAYQRSEPKWQKEVSEPMSQQSQELVERAKKKTTGSKLYPKRPGWDASHFITYRNWRQWRGLGDATREIPEGYADEEHKVVAELNRMARLGIHGSLRQIKDAIGG